MGSERFNRVAIVSLLKEKFPELEDMTSQQIQEFLNQQTGCNVTSDAPNGVAFDLWRQALSKDHPELWPYTAEHLSKIKERTWTMLEEEKERLSKLPK